RCPVNRMTSLAPQPADIWPADCASYWRIANATARCQFVRSAEACDAESGLISYLSAFVCQVPDWAKPLYLAACAIWLLLLFVTLATTADNFFCPSLTVMSDNLRLSHNLAGVTLLAFGNGAPDIFSSLAAVLQSDSGDASLAFGALLGAGVFVTTVVAGVVSAVRPFKAMERPLLKDLVFYLAALYLAFYAIYRGRINLAEAVCFLGLYLAFVVVTLVSRLIRSYARRRRHGHRRPHPHGAAIGVNSPADQLTAAAAGSYGERAPLLHSYVADELQSGRVGVSSSGSVGAATVNDGLLYTVRYAIQHPPSGRRYDLDGAELDIDEDEDDVENVAEFRGGRADALSADVAVSRSLQSVDLATPPSASPSAGLLGCGGGGGGFSADSSLLVQLARRLAPIDLVAWREGGLAARLLELAKAPCLLPLSLAVPVVDDDQPLRGWCRPLNCLQLAVGPLVCLLASGLYSVPVPTADSQVLLLYICAPVLAVIAFVALCKSETDRPPVWHDCLAWLGFITAVLIIYLVANEVVALLQAFGVLLNVSKATLGLTLLAWGNSVGDLISNVALARRGYPRMAISACFGGPMFNLLVGVGLSFTVLLARHRASSVRLLGDRLDFVLLGGLAASLCFTLVYSVFGRFQLGRGYAIVLLLMYAAFLTLALLVEFRLVPLFG
ncbi:hypothetical protein BOX15_Mlig023439g3, partial [Macrostomum lignano]